MATKTRKTKNKTTPKFAPEHYFVVVYTDKGFTIDGETASAVFHEGTVYVGDGKWEYCDRLGDEVEKQDVEAFNLLHHALTKLNKTKPKRKYAKVSEAKKCDHPISTWEHRYAEDSKLGDYYTCGLCGEVTQVG
jgi:hypothetical protein